MKHARRNGITVNRILRLLGWLLSALALLAIGDALLSLIKSGRYVLDVLVASLLWPLGLMLATRRWAPLFRILLLFFGVLAAYALTAVIFSLLGYPDLIGTFYPWPTTSPIHLLPGGLQALSVLVAGWTNRKIAQQVQKVETRKDPPRSQGS